MINNRAFLVRLIHHLIIPLIIFCGIIALTRTSNFEDLAVKLYFIIALMIIGYLIIKEIIFLPQFFKRRRSVRIKKDFLIGRSETNRTFFYNLRPSVNDIELQIFNGSKVILFFDKRKLYLELHSIFKKEQIELSQIDYIIYEFLPIRMFVVKHDWGKTRWYCDYFIKFKNSNRKKLLITITSDRDHLKDRIEKAAGNTNEYNFKLGYEFANLLSSNLHLKFIALDHSKKITAANNV